MIVVMPDSSGGVHKVVKEHTIKKIKVTIAQAVRYMANAESNSPSDS